MLFEVFIFLSKHSYDRFINFVASYRTSLGKRKLLSRLPDMSTMEKEYKNKLEEVRLRTPRFLFRAWSRRSGGDRRLNTVERITPLAFLRGQNRKSPYDMTIHELKAMVHGHLEGDHIATEFSSWSQSLSFVLSVYDTEYISIIDTQELRSTNPAYYVPLMPIHDPGEFNYDHEYLVFGVVQRPAHRAVPYREFEALHLPSGVYGLIENRRVSEGLVRRCRAIGERYGDTFALAATLALIASQTIPHHSTRDIRESPEEMAVLRAGVRGLPIPRSWRSDPSIMGAVVHTQDWMDVKQFIRLMRCCIQDDQAAEDAQKEERRSARLKSHLHIDMNRYGKKANDGKNEMSGEDVEMEDA